VGRIVGEGKSKLKLSAMADIGRIDYDDIPPKSESSLDMVRVACYIHQVDKGIDLAHHCMDKGYEATINLMAVSTVGLRDLEEGLNDLGKSRVPVIYLVDSFGAFYSEDIDVLAKKYMESLPGKTIGIHAHNNQQLAFANTIEGIRFDCNLVDGSLYGIGRGAGNCALELLIAFLKNPKFSIEPILKVIQDYMIPMRDEIEWGYLIPYVITGALNQHPRAAIAMRKTEDKDKYAEFYNEIADLHD
jgi:4-hydroxy 2-oxovalerate aldolase